MPLQFTWQPNQTPPNPDVVNRGLQLGGDDASITAPTDGRVKLVEVGGGTGPNRGPSETSTERLIATFHGKFHRRATGPVATRLTFEILIGSATVAAHDQNVLGFDPECIFGEDAFVLTFVNREFVIWLPFYVDTRSEGRFLEIQAVAETGSGNSVTTLGRSMVLNVLIRRNHAIDTTSDFNNTAIAYTGALCGNLIASHEAYILKGGSPDPAQSTPQTIVLRPGFFPVAAAGSPGLTFSAYPSGSLRVLLLTDLLDDLVPPNSFLTSSVTGVTAATVAQVRAATTQRFKDAIKPALTDILTDAGFAGSQALWQDEAGAAALAGAFTGAFTRSTVGTREWRLRNSASPLATSFWNFFVGSNDGLQTAGEGEHIASANTQRTIGGQQAFLENTIPIGQGNKQVERPIQIVSGVFRDLLTTQSGVPRRFPNRAAFDTAVDKVAAKLTLLIAHEIGHSLGLMHKGKVVTGSNYSESNGSPVLCIMSSDVDSGGFGTGVKFSAQVKVIWAAAFGVTPTFSDAVLQNKTWTAAEVTTVDWVTRTSRFLRAHGEVSIRRPFLGTVNPTSPGPPAFASTPPAVQRGTFVP